MLQERLPIYLICFDVSFYGNSLRQSCLLWYCHLSVVLLIWFFLLVPPCVLWSPFERCLANGNATFFSCFFRLHILSPFSFCPKETSVHRGNHNSILRVKREEIKQIKKPSLIFLPRQVKWEQNLWKAISFFNKD
jgi:hypothetical protein